MIQVGKPSITLKVENIEDPIRSIELDVKPEHQPAYPQNVIAYVEGEKTDSVLFSVDIMII